MERSREIVEEMERADREAELEAQDAASAAEAEGRAEMEAADAAERA